MLRKGGQIAAARLQLNGRAVEQPRVNDSPARATGATYFGCACAAKVNIAAGCREENDKKVRINQQSQSVVPLIGAGSPMTDSVCT